MPPADHSAVDGGMPSEPPPTRTVADAMITNIKISGVHATVADLRALFVDEHVQSAVIVDAGMLLTVVDRSDVDGTTPADLPAVQLGGRRQRMIGPSADLELARQQLLRSGRRRLAVVDADGRLRGLLCLKRGLAGFCSDHDVSARVQASRD